MCKDTVVSTVNNTKPCLQNTRYKVKCAKEKNRLSGHRVHRKGLDLEEYAFIITQTISWKANPWL